MASMAAKLAPLNRPNLSREGAALQRSVRAELDWMRQSVSGGRMDSSTFSDVGSKAGKPKGPKKSSKKK
jgi:hypothetical protein